MLLASAKNAGEDLKRTLAMLAGLTVAASCCVMLPGCRGSDRRRDGPHALRGGSPIVRVPFEPKPDDPSTTNDESNDQPLARSFRHPDTERLDADVDEDTLLRLYFPKGGWVDFEDCELDDFEGQCDDENGREWVFEGKR
jgi:hypothetical protein